MKAAVDSFTLAGNPPRYPPLLSVENGRWSITARPLLGGPDDDQSPYYSYMANVRFGTPIELPPVQEAMVGETRYRARTSHTAESGKSGLWVREDGEERLLAEFTEDSMSNFVVFDDQLLFVVDETQLWRADPLGAELLTDSLTRIDQLTPASDLLYFVADDGAHGLEIWQTDGSSDGTLLAADVLPGPQDSAPSDLIAVGDSLFFVAEDGVVGREIFQIEPDVDAVFADADGDGEVTFADFLVLASNFGQRTDQGRLTGDFNGNGEVDFMDFLVLARQI